MTIMGNIRLDGARRIVTVSRELSASRAEVWDAIVDPDRMARWLGRLERNGDRFVLTMSSSNDQSATGEILVCTRPERIEASWSHGAEPETLVQADLEQTDGGTRLTLTHRRMPAVKAAEYGADWEDFLTGLAALLGAGSGGEGDATGDAPDAGAAYREYREQEAALVRGRLARDGNGTSVHLQRLLDASPSRVWDAITTPDGLAGWLWPVVSWPDDPARQRRLEPGDSFSLGDPNMPDQAQRTRVLDLQPQRSITISWGVHGTSVRLAIEAAGDGTMFTLDQSAAADEFAAGRMRSGPDYAAGWHSLLDGLVLSLSGLTVPTPEGLWEAAYAVYSRS